MKKVGIMQPYIFPYIGYFQLLNAVDHYVIYDDVQFIKGGWINRNNILIGKQKVLFTIRLQGASANKLINEINISDDFDKFLRGVDMAYSKAPHHNEVMQLLARICKYEDKNLGRFIGNSIMEIADYLGVNTTIIYSSDLKKDMGLRAQSKVIAICHELGAGQYYNALGGKELYDKKIFKEEGIELKFLHPTLKEYRQFSESTFVPGLSIIDVMMFNDTDEIRSLLEEYRLE